MIALLCRVAKGPFRTVISIYTPCSVNAWGRYLDPPQLEVEFLHLKSAHSSRVSSNMKSASNLSILFLTCLLRILGDRPHSRLHFLRFIHHFHSLIPIAIRVPTSHLSSSNPHFYTCYTFYTAIKVIQHSIVTLWHSIHRSFCCLAAPPCQPLPSGR